jgi:hypothetical protein
MLAIVPASVASQQAGFDDSPVALPSKELAHVHLATPLAGEHAQAVCIARLELTLIPAAGTCRCPGYLLLQQAIPPISHQHTYAGRLGLGSVTHGCCAHSTSQPGIDLQLSQGC